MEKISLQSTYTRVSLYARLSGPVNAKKAADPGDAPTDQTAGNTAGAVAEADGLKSGECARSKDGDTFTLSIEARTLQISKTITIETTGSGDGADAAGAAGQSQQPGGKDRLTGMVSSLMDALKTMGGKNGKHRHHFPHLSDPEDVANKILDRLDKDYAEKGGSKTDFAAEIKKKLADWKASGSSSRTTVEYQEFRSDVHMQLTSGLDSWAKGENPAGTDAATGTGAGASGASAGTATPALTEI